MQQTTNALTRESDGQRARLIFNENVGDAASRVNA